jgi:hypothetical protein
MTRSTSDPEAFLHLRQEQVLRREAAMADPLLMGILQEGVERLAVGVDAIRPWIIAEDCL